MESEQFIRVDGVEVMRGEALSIRVLFFNLNGRNFLNRTAVVRPRQSYREYLMDFAYMTDVKVKEGTLVELVDAATGNVLLRHTMGIDLPGSYVNVKGEVVAMEELA